MASMKVCVIRLLLLLLLFAANPAIGSAVFDELGRLTNPEEVFYIHNPPQKGSPKKPIPKVDAYDAQTPGAKWHISQYEDAGTGAKLRNSFLIFQNPYVLGTGYLDMSDVKIPEDIMKIK
jgi:hypothetical protein